MFKKLQAVYGVASFLPSFEMESLAGVVYLLVKQKSISFLKWAFVAVVRRRQAEGSIPKRDTVTPFSKRCTSSEGCRSETSICVNFKVIQQGPCLKQICEHSLVSV